MTTQYLTYLNSALLALNSLRIELDSAFWCLDEHAIGWPEFGSGEGLHMVAPAPFNHLGIALLQVGRSAYRTGPAIYCIALHDPSFDGNPTGLGLLGSLSGAPISCPFLR